MRSAGASHASLSAKSACAEARASSIPVAPVLAKVAIAERSKGEKTVASDSPASGGGPACGSAVTVRRPRHARSPMRDIHRAEWNSRSR